MIGFVIISVLRIVLGLYLIVLLFRLTELQNFRTAHEKLKREMRKK